ncbi:MAG: hypothetical protein ACP5OP_04345 [Leptospirillia bacterium]
MAWRGLVGVGESRDLLPRFSQRNLPPSESGPSLSLWPGWRSVRALKSDAGLRPVFPPTADRTRLLLRAFALASFRLSPLESRFNVDRI